MVTEEIEVIDKQKLIEALNKEYAAPPFGSYEAAFFVKGLMIRVDRGEFDVKPVRNCASCCHGVFPIKEICRQCTDTNNKWEPKKIYWVNPKCCPNCVCGAGDNCIGPACLHWPFSNKKEARIDALEKRIDAIEKNRSKKKPTRFIVEPIPGFEADEKYVAQYRCYEVEI